jgi:hypothetical protein
MTTRHYAKLFAEAPERGVEPVEVIRRAREKVAGDGEQEVSA